MHVICISNILVVNAVQRDKNVHVIQGGDIGGRRGSNTPISKWGGGQGTPAFTAAL